jgi:hypothetical protein
VIKGFAPGPSVNLKQDFEAWAKETHALGVTKGYHDLGADAEAVPKKLKKAYADNAREIACKQMCLAGFRLAELLNDLFPKATD